MVVLCAGESDEVIAFRVAVRAFVKTMQPKAEAFVLATKNPARLRKFHRRDAAEVFLKDGNPAVE